MFGLCYHACIYQASTLLEHQYQYQVLMLPFGLCLITYKWVPHHLLMHYTLDMICHITSYFDTFSMTYFVVMDIWTVNPHMWWYGMQVPCMLQWNLFYWHGDIDDDFAFACVICHHIWYFWTCYAWMWIVWHERNPWFYLDIWLWVIGCDLMELSNTLGIL